MNKIHDLVESGEVKIECYPKARTHGMSVPTMSKAISVEHVPTGNIVICCHHRSQHKNKELALELIELLIQDYLGK